jgi:hypothetical protein
MIVSSSSDFVYLYLQLAQPLPPEFVDDAYDRLLTALVRTCWRCRACAESSPEMHVYQMQLELTLAA